MEKYDIYYTSVHVEHTTVEADSEEKAMDGVPYIDEACALGISNNIVVYRHHMKNGSMFADICTDKSFYESHKTIKFDTLSTFGEYEIVAVSQR